MSPSSEILFGSTNSDTINFTQKNTAIMSNLEYYNFITIPIEDVTSATKNFADENLITQSRNAKLYKGQLRLQSGLVINIVARKCVQASICVNELMMVKNLKHKNIVSNYRLAAGNSDHPLLINKHEANGSLDKHLSGSTLTWMQRLRICVGVADALRYIHYDAIKGDSVIHANIKSSKILLDHNWEPMLYGFGYAMRTKRHHLCPVSKYKGTLQYMDPAYENSGGLTPSSDIFSFGIVLFEVLFGRKASIPIPNEDNWHFARFARLHYQEGKLDDMIDPDLRKQMDLESYNIFCETAYCCLMEQRGQRPDIDQIVKTLKRALDLHQEHQTPEKAPSTLGAKSSNQLKVKKFEQLKIGLSNIISATNNFCETYRIGSGGYGMVYKAKLENVNEINSWENDFPKTNGTVAIKRITKRVDGQGEQGFFAEIELLSNCKHRNIVSLLGFCVEDSEMILVYEYVANGSLDDYFKNIHKMTNLTWAQRIQICLDIAYGLNYLHSITEDKQMIVHRDIKSANILLDDNWVAKIGDFGLSKLHNSNQQGSTLVTANIAGTEVYLDPEYMNTGKLKKESDIYSFGVVLFEIMCGRLAYDNIYTVNNEKGLPSVVRRCFTEGTLKEMVDPKIREANENIFMLTEGLNQKSLDTFSKIAYQCLAETQAERPAMEVVIKELEKALHLQKTTKDNLHISLEDIKLATENFSDYKSIGEGRYWKQYKGEVPHANGNGHTTLIAKRWDSNSDEGNRQFLTELKTLFDFKHENIIGLAGYCNEITEKIIIYEHVSKGRLDKHLNDASLTWMKRLKICIDIANGLKFLHSGGVVKTSKVADTMMIHRDIKSSCILLDGDCKAKISNFELASKTWAVEKIEHITDNAYGSLGYVCPEYGQGYFTEKSDIYSLGVVLMEILCGRWTSPQGCENHYQFLGPLTKRGSKKRILHKMVFNGIRKQIGPKSLAKFSQIASDCLLTDFNKRPYAANVVEELKKALEFQEDYEIWKPKLPRGYSKIFRLSSTPNIHYTKMKMELYDMLSKGVLIEDSKVWFLLQSNGERNVLISARKFLYHNRWLRKWRSNPESRFQKVAEILDISKLNIQTRITARFLSPGIYYGVYLVFKFFGPKIPPAKRMYVNLKYQMGDEKLHSYFATRREDGWMMIELYRFLNHMEDIDFEVLLESFSLCYCGSRFAYIEGIEFRAIDNMKHKEIEKSQEYQQVLKSSPKMVEMERFNPNKIFKTSKSYGEVLKVPFSFGNNFSQPFKGISLYKVNEKKCYTLSAKEALHDSSNEKLYKLKPLAESSFKWINKKKSHPISSFSSFKGVNQKKLHVLSTNSRIKVTNQKKRQMLSPKIRRLKVVNKKKFQMLSTKSRFKGVNEKKHQMISRNSSLKGVNQKKLLHMLSTNTRLKVANIKKRQMLLSKSRFKELIELLPQQVLRINFKIKIQMLSRDTDYVCYLVFKLSEHCYGLHCPVIVRDILHWKTKETGILYFKSPSPRNLHNTDWVPKKRKDGWMEVVVWKFNKCYEGKYDHLFANLKLICYEGTMSGLILRGVELRPI